MKLKRWLTLFMVTWCCIGTLYAIDVRTSVTLIGHESDYQILGSVTLDVRNNAFANASPSNPVYIRLRTLHSRGWSKTVVDLRPNANTSYDVPINLAIYPGDGATNLNPGIPASAVQLVRMIKGEQGAFIRITDSSSDWINNSGSFVAPSNTNGASITIGIRSGNSVQPGAHTPSGGNEFSDSHQLASTLLCGNYRETPNFDVDDVEVLDFVSADSSTSGVEDGDQAVLGSLLGISFSNDVVVARGAANFPCFEYHFNAERFDAPAFQLVLNQLNRVAIRDFELRIPPVFLSNTSDFPWQAGSRLFLLLPDYPVAIARQGAVNGMPFPTSYYPVRLGQTQPVLKPEGDGNWRVKTIMWDGQIAGYEFELLEGEFGTNETLRIEELTGQTDGEFERASLSLSATGFYVNERVTDGEIRQIGPITHKTFDVERTSNQFERMVIPYTAQDRDDWQMTTHLINPTNAPVRFAMYFYNRHGVLLRILGDQSLPANGAKQFDIREMYGDTVGDLTQWVEILSEGTLSASGVIEDRNASLLDIFPAVTQFRETLFGPHLPTRTDAWDTKAYVISSDLNSDTAIFIGLPGQALSNRVNPVFIPGGSVAFSDSNFFDGSGRSPWFRVMVESQQGAGLVLFSRKDVEGQLVSIPMDEAPTERWLFDHVANRQNGWWNGLVILNPNDQSTQAEIIGYNDRGSQVVRRTLTVPSQTRLVDTLEQWFPNWDQSPLARLSIRCSEPVISFLLMGREAQSILTRVTGNAPSGTSLQLGFLPPSDQDWLGLALTNTITGPITITLHPYHEDGSAGPTATIQLEQSEKRVFLLDQVMPDAAGYSHLKLEATAPIRGMALTGDRAGNQLATVPLTQTP